MNCPNCGHEITAPFNYSKKLADDIEERLTHYGHPQQRNPHKYQAYCSVRVVIALHVEGIKGARQITEEQYKQGIEVLDRILPEKPTEADC